MNAALQRAEADELPLELEAFEQPGTWNKIVVGLRELPRASDGHLPEREVGVVGRHHATVPERVGRRNHLRRCGFAIAFLGPSCA
jgi:hypothetical protein